MKRHKSIGLRILLGIAGVACGLGIQAFGSIFSKVTGLGIVGDTLFALLGFAAMAYLIYRWAIK